MAQSVLELVDGIQPVKQSITSILFIVTLRLYIMHFVNAMRNITVLWGMLHSKQACKQLICQILFTWMLFDITAE